MRRFGLVGKTLKHSFSRDFFTRKFKEEGVLDCEYLNFELSSIEEIQRLPLNFPGLEGLNVTIPYKEEVLPYTTIKSEAVRAIGACNCIKISGNEWRAYNTDAPAFADSLKPLLTPFQKKALVFGTGGAAKAVCYALHSLDIDYILVSRSPSKRSISYADIDRGLLDEYSILVNTTPVGMYPQVHDVLPLPYEHISGQHLLYDLVYNPTKSRFLEEGEKMGARITNGYNMLRLQAEESWKIWNDSAF